MSEFAEVLATVTFSLVMVVGCIIAVLFVLEHLEDKKIAKRLKLAKEICNMANMDDSVFDYVFGKDEELRAVLTAQRERER
jgi:hypothetical protein